MNSCEFVVLISTLACSIAKGKSEDEINVLSTAFSQLGDTLATIIAFDANCYNNDENDNRGAVTINEEDN